jgi:hypothetical protein
MAGPKLTAVVAQLDEVLVGIAQVAADEGELSFTVNDLTAGTSSRFTMNIGTGVPSSRYASAPNSATLRGARRAASPPPAQTEVAVFSGSGGKEHREPQARDRG